MTAISLPHFDVTINVNQQVLRLEVAVHMSPVMEVLEAEDHRGSVEPCMALFQRAGAGLWAGVDGMGWDGIGREVVGSGGHIDG